MPLELQIIRAREFVRLGARGHLDFESSKRALQDLAMACRKRGVDRALLDLRELPPPPEPLFNASELAALVETFRSAGFSRRQRLAVLYRCDPHHGARMFAFIGALRGWKVRAFDDFEKAIFWLSAESDAPRKQQGEEVPITTTTTKTKSASRRSASQDRLTVTDGQTD
jgi:hypothetical protein